MSENKLTVKEIISELEKLPEEAEVLIPSFRNDIRYESIDRTLFTEDFNGFVLKLIPKSGV